MYTLKAFPYEWARTQNDLGSAYSDRIKGAKADNLETAIAYYQEPLKVYTLKAFPYEWARTQNDLGFAYSYRIKGDKADNVKKAIAYYQESLKVVIPKGFPQESLWTGRNLGNLAFREKNWRLAIKAYKGAIEAIEISRSWAMTPQSKQEVIETGIDVYHNIVQAYINIDQIPLALEYVERSKTRNLVELLANRNLQPRGNFSHAILEELDRLRDEIRTEQICLANQERKYNILLSESSQSSPSSRPDRTRLNQLQQELDNFIAREITPIDPNFVLTQKVKPIALSEIQALIDQQTAILEWYIGGDRILAFIITSDSLKVWQSTKEDLENLFKWKDEYLEIYEQNKTKWIKTLDCRLNNLRNILHPDRLLELIPDTCNQLILIPHYFLHIFPLHTMPLNNGKFLYECFSKGVGYVPSCQLLKLVQESKSQHQKEFNRLFAIQNPTRKDGKPLLGSNLEIARISQYFDLQSIIIAESQASKTMLVQQRENLKSTHCLHFSCHGKFNSKSPLDSALILADPEGDLGKSANLTLAGIFEKLDLEKCRLVTLSACESGIIDPTVISDEYIGIPSGFLFAGSLSVVSTLWTVDPLATTLFMTKFYRYLKRSSGLNQGSIAIASTKAQTWLRNLTSKKLKRIKDSQQFQQLLKEVFQNQKRDYNKFKDLLEAAVKRGSYPFVNPYYWTAFIATGI